MADGGIRKRGLTIRRSFELTIIDDFRANNYVICIVNHCSLKWISWKDSHIKPPLGDHGQIRFRQQGFILLLALAAYKHHDQMCEKHTMLQREDRIGLSVYIYSV
jgi:hypothetical protein